jgi:uncharacterized protein YbjT (DUF2867 family)
MTTPTVGLISATGLLGSALLPALSAAPIKLVVLHRPTSKLPPLDVEARPLDIGGSREEVHAALAGIDILVNASGKTDPAADRAFLEHLAGLPLKAYIPSDYSLNYAPSETVGVQLIEGKEALTARARALGIPTTTVHNGVFEPFVLSPFTGVDLANSTLTLVPGAEERALPITSPGYLAAAVAEIVQLPTINQSYTVVEYTATGKQIAAALEEAGKRVTIEAWSDEDAAAARASGPFGALSAAVRVKWGRGEWPAPDAYTPKKERRDIRRAVKDALKA